MKQFLHRLLNKHKTGIQNRRREELATNPAVIYAIGDVHGCVAELKRLEQKIVADARSREGEKLIVCLGDYIDRGPSSASVLDHLLAPAPEGFARICLAGNHEEMFIGVATGEIAHEAWINAGGRQTLASYGVHAVEGSRKNDLRQQLERNVPGRHLEFMTSLPSTLRVGRYCFVHAGIDPALPLDQQDEGVLLWSRPYDFDWPEHDIGFTVIHGHTPVPRVEFRPNRVNLDIGAFRTGVLAAVRIENGTISVLLSD